MPIPEALDWGTKVFAPYFTGMAPSAVTVGMAHMCLAECRIIFEGSEMILGLNPNDCIGADLKEKRKNLFMCTVGVITELVRKSGFAVRHDSTQMVVLPSGFLYIIASTGCAGLRWSISCDDEDTQRVQYHLDNVLKAFPECANASQGYYQFFKWLQA